MSTTLKQFQSKACVDLQTSEIIADREKTLPCFGFYVNSPNSGKTRVIARLCALTATTQNLIFVPERSLTQWHKELQGQKVNAAVFRTSEIQSYFAFEFAIDSRHVVLVGVSDRQDTINLGVLHSRQWDRVIIDTSQLRPFFINNRLFTLCASYFWIVTSNTRVVDDFWALRPIYFVCDTYTKEKLTIDRYASYDNGLAISARYVRDQILAAIYQKIQVHTNKSTGTFGPNDFIQRSGKIITQIKANFSNLAEEKCPVCFEKLTECKQVLVADCCYTFVCENCFLSHVEVRQEMSTPPDCMLCRAKVSSHSIYAIHNDFTEALVSTILKNLSLRKNHKTVIYMKQPQLLRTLLLDRGIEVGFAESADLSEKKSLGTENLVMVDAAQHYENVDFSRYSHLILFEPKLKTRALSLWPLLRESKLLWITYLPPNGQKLIKEIEATPLISHLA